MAAQAFIEHCIGSYLWHSGRLWRHLPALIKSSGAGLAYGRHLHATALRHAARQQYFGTYFLRNRAELELVRRLVQRKPPSGRLDIAVLACSKGAEVYSIVWAIRSAAPELRLRVHAVDISQEILDFARAGTYARQSLILSTQRADETPVEGSLIARNTSREQSTPIFERMAPDEMKQMFEIDGDFARIKPWLREGIAWVCGDAGDPSLARELGPKDMVFANRFLCHMRPSAAEKVLCNVATLVKPGGYLFASGVDIELRSKVAQSLGWRPVIELIREMHDGDPSLRAGWPLNYWGLEPFREDRLDWRTRYASVFQIGEVADVVHSFNEVASSCVPAC